VYIYYTSHKAKAYTWSYMSAVVHKLSPLPPGALSKIKLILAWEEGGITQSMNTAF